METKLRSFLYCFLTLCTVCLFSGCNQGEIGKITQSTMVPVVDDTINHVLAGRYAERYHTQNPKIVLRANYCDANQVRKIVANEECKGLRIYRAINDEGELGVIVVGVDDKGNDMIDQDGEPASERFTVIESYGKCPYNCDRAKSPLCKTCEGH